MYFTLGLLMFGHVLHLVHPGVHQPAPHLQLLHHGILHHPGSFGTNPSLNSQYLKYPANREIEKSELPMGIEIARVLG